MMNFENLRALTPRKIQRSTTLHSEVISKKWPENGQNGQNVFYAIFWPANC